MAIHHATLKKAEKAGIILTEQEGGDILAHWPKHNVRVTGREAKYLLADMFAIKDMTENYASFKYEVQEDQTVNITVRGTDISVEGMRADAAFRKAKELWQESRSELDVDDEDADKEVEEEVAQEIAEEEPEKSGSVVASKYRAIYKERGTPNHCGDWLAAVLINMTTNDAGINTALFEAICLENGVDLSGYKHEGHGWQGRLRMTGRNLLAKAVWLGGGILKLPEAMGEPMNAPQEWMESRIYKAPKAKATPKVEIAPSAEPETPENEQQPEQVPAQVDPTDAELQPA